MPATQRGDGTLGTGDEGGPNRPVSIASAAALQNQVVMSFTVPTISEFDGTLLRDWQGWYWADGRREPRVRDLRLEEIAPDWRCVRRGRLAWIEIPTDWRAEIGHDELIRAVTELVRDYASIGLIEDTGAAATVGRRGHRRSGYRVPLSAWRLIMAQPIGATWDPTDHADIRARAHALGYAGPDVER